MSAADSRAAIDLVAAKRQLLGAEDFAAYAFLALAILAHHAPEVVTFVIDQTDRQLEGDPR